MFRIIGTILGIILSGSFWGALLGFLLGGLADLIRSSKVTFFRSGSNLSPDEFIKSILIFTAAVVKSDSDQMQRTELEYVRNYLAARIGAAKTQDALLILRDILTKDFDIQVICEDLAARCSIHEKLLIVQFLFGLATSDGNVSQKEMQMIQQIAMWMGMRQADFEALKAMLFNGFYSGRYQHQQQYNQQTSPRYTYNIANDYKALEISSSATDDEVKKAYRKQAMKHHPDKVNHLGDDIRKAAEEKFSLLNESYDRIKKSRGMH